MFSRSSSIYVVLLGLFEAQPIAKAQHITTPDTSSVTVPPIVMSGQTVAPNNVSAAEMAYHVALSEIRASDAILMTDSKVPRDSIQQVVTRQAIHWAAQLRANPPRGIQLDPAGGVTVIAGQESEAIRTIAERLATPRLTLNDRAYTYLAAIRAFSPQGHPDRLPIAERYLSALDSLGPKAAYWQQTAHRELVDVYYMLGRGHDVVRHGTRAVALLPYLDFVDRSRTYENAQFYAEIIDAFANQQEGVSRLSSLNTTFLAAAKPSAEALAKEPDLAWTGEQNLSRARDVIQISTRLGTHGDDIVGNYWVNLPSAGAVHGDTVIAMADGHIHVVDFGSYTCPPCLMAITSLQRVQERYPTVRMISVTWTEGAWSNRLVDADEEAEHLRTYYTEELKIRFPISIWKGMKQRTDDDGLLPVDAGGPNLKHYPLVAKPNICVIDGKGIIRRIYLGFSRDTEAHLTALLDYLNRESGNATAGVAHVGAAPSHVSLGRS